MPAELPAPVSSDSPPSISRVSDELQALPLNLIAMLRGCNTAQLKQTQAFVTKLIDEQQNAFKGLDLGTQILTKLAEIDREQRCSGVVPLDALRPHFGHVPRNVFDDMLLDMERRSVVALREARTLRSRRANDGIQSERGLLFFVVVR